MRIAVDLNVLLDVAQNRVPHYQASEEVLARARRGEYEAVISGHAVTTLFYVIAKFAGCLPLTRPWTTCCRSSVSSDQTRRFSCERGVWS